MRQPKTGATRGRAFLLIGLSAFIAIGCGDDDSNPALASSQGSLPPGDGYPPQGKSSGQDLAFAGSCVRRILRSQDSD